MTTQSPINISFLDFILVMIFFGYKIGGLLSGFDEIDAFSVLHLDNKTPGMLFFYLFV